tara:strand:+ start:1418 stop:1672 length:255 start_codon:yes stop_codon:yes gene_type:complete
MMGLTNKDRFRNYAEQILLVAESPLPHHAIKDRVLNLLEREGKSIYSMDNIPSRAISTLLRTDSQKRFLRVSQKPDKWILKGEE